MKNHDERIPWEVVVRRKNGRWIRAYKGGYSQYAAKKRARALDKIYEEGFILEIQEVPPQWRGKERF